MSATGVGWPVSSVAQVDPTAESGSVLLEEHIKAMLKEHPELILEALAENEIAVLELVARGTETRTSGGTATPSG